MDPFLIPTNPLHAKLHDDLIKFVRDHAWEWHDQHRAKREFMRALASELQVMTALFAREMGSHGLYMNAADLAWRVAESRNYTASEMLP